MVTRAIRPSPLSQCGRVLAILQDGNPHAMRDIHCAAGTMRLNSRVAELRNTLRPQGQTIVCWRGTDDYYYRLVTLTELASLAEPEPSSPGTAAASGSAGEAAQLALEIPRSAYEARA